LGGQRYFVGDRADVPILEVPPVVVVAMHELLDPSLEFGESGEGVPATPSYYSHLLFSNSH